MHLYTYRYLIVFTGKGSLTVCCVYVSILRTEGKTYVEHVYERASIRICSGGGIDLAKTKMSVCMFVCVNGRR